MRLIFWIFFSVPDVEFSEWTYLRMENEWILILLIFCSILPLKEEKVTSISLMAHPAAKILRCNWNLTLGFECGISLSLYTRNLIVP